jgi:hypothetical protein
LASLAGGIRDALHWIRLLRFPLAYSFCISPALSCIKRKKGLQQPRGWGINE